MKTTLKSVQRLAATLLALGMLSACDVHEFPSETTTDTREIVLHLNFDTDLPTHQVVDYPTTRAASANPEDYDIRYQLRIYKAGADGTFASDGYTTALETRDEVTNPDHDLRLRLEAGHYRFVVWADYVDEGSQTDKFYDTSRFEEVTLQGDSHPGNTDFRDAFSGTAEAVVEAGTAGAPQEVTVALERPMARYNFVTTDLDVFITRVLAQQAAAAQASGQREEKTGTKAVSLADYRVTFLYTGFMPSAFDIFRNAPIDARTGVSFEGQIRQLSDTEAEMGFDYVFVNGSESAVQVALQICDNAGEVIATAGPVDVPIVRSKHTTVRGAFLTSEASGSVGIDPGFDGEWNFEIR